MDQQQLVLLVLLDLCTAFDTRDYSQLLLHFKTRLGIGGHVHAWIKSNLTDRYQLIATEGIKAAKTQLKYGSLQGSVLGPLLFSLYIMLPAGDIIRQHGINCHFIHF